MDVINVLFAGKSVNEHVDALPKTQAEAGLVADGIGAAQMVAEKFPKQFGAAGTPIIAAGLLAINLLQLECGVTLNVDKGEKFGQASDAMQKVVDTLEGAFPREDWQGTGSTAYTRQNTHQQDRADEVSKTDRKIQGIISKQGEQLETCKDALDKAATGLTFAIPVALAAKAIPVYGLAIAEGIEIAAVAIALPVCEAAMLVMTAEALSNAFQIAAAAVGYEQAAAAATPSGGDHVFDPSPTAGQPPANGSAPPATNPAPAPPTPAPSGGGTPSNGGGAPVGGGGSSSGAGGGTPSTPSPSMPSPSVPSVPTMPSMPAASSGGASGGIGELAKAMGSALGGLSGGSGSGGSGGGLGGILSAVPQIVTGAIQADQQSGQQPDQVAANRDAGSKSADTKTRDGGDEKTDSPAKSGQPDGSKAGAGAGSHVTSERAPVGSASEGREPAFGQTSQANQPIRREREQR